MPDVLITAELTEEQALALAQFLKRSCFTDYRSNAVGDTEAYLMIEAGNVIRKALADAGFAPR